MSVGSEHTFYTRTFKHSNEYSAFRRHMTSLAKVNNLKQEPVHIAFEKCFEDDRQRMRSLDDEIEMVLRQHENIENKDKLYVTMIINAAGKGLLVYSGWNETLHQRYIKEYQRDVADRSENITYNILCLISQSNYGMMVNLLCEFAYRKKSNAYVLHWAPKSQIFMGDLYGKFRLDIPEDTSGDHIMMFYTIADIRKQCHVAFQEERDTSIDEKGTSAAEDAANKTQNEIHQLTYEAAVADTRKQIMVAYDEAKALAEKAYKYEYDRGESHLLKMQALVQDLIQNDKKASAAQKAAWLPEDEKLLKDIEYAIYSISSDFLMNPKRVRKTINENRAKRANEQWKKQDHMIDRPMKTKEKIIEEEKKLDTKYQKTKKQAENFEEEREYVKALNKYEVLLQMRTNLYRPLYQEIHDLKWQKERLAHNEQEIRRLAAKHQDLKELHEELQKIDQESRERREAENEAQAEADEIDEQAGKYMQAKNKERKDSIMEQVAHMDLDAHTESSNRTTKNERHKLMLNYLENKYKRQTETIMNFARKHPREFRNTYNKFQDMEDTMKEDVEQWRGQNPESIAKLHKVQNDIRSFIKPLLDDLHKYIEKDEEAYEASQSEHKKQMTDKKRKDAAQLHTSNKKKATKKKKKVRRTAWIPGPDIWIPNRGYR